MGASLGRPTEHDLDVEFCGSTTVSRQDERYSVLVVEDNIINQKVLSSQLSKLGHSVGVASNGVEALDYLRASRHWRTLPATEAEKANLPAVDLILMDVEMPVMDGLECVRKIRELEARGEIVSHIPIISVSANARDEQMRQALDCGMDDAISKPFRIVDLVPKMHRLVNEKAPDFAH
ncbi:hypothetical protein ANO11243_009700 [Dothideomycetidae sp. 11243]|nr:hypothetical protein ANO11243_009700 [fungal sp. No.11243]